MADFLALLDNAAPFFLSALLIYLILEATWEACLWVYGLVKLFGVHRDDVHEALTLERALSPFKAGKRDRNGNLAPSPD